MRVLINGEPYFKGTGYYGGEYEILGTIKEEHMDLILDILDAYIEVKESLLGVETMDKNVLLNLYNLVFDEKGNVRPCGRENCVNLITFIEGVTHTHGFYGNADSGIMNTEVIKQYVKSVM